jgi:hypothetical protein
MAKNIAQGVAPRQTNGSVRKKQSVLRPKRNAFASATSMKQPGVAPACESHDTISAFSILSAPASKIA